MYAEPSNHNDDNKNKSPERAAAGPALSKKVVVGVITVLTQRSGIASCARHVQTPSTMLGRGALVDLHSNDTVYQTS